MNVSKTCEAAGGGNATLRMYVLVADGMHMPSKAVLWRNPCRRVAGREGILYQGRPSEILSSVQAFNGESTYVHGS